MAVDTVSMGKRLRNIREESGMRQREFAKEINVSQQTLSRYENGQSVIPYEVLINVVDKFDVSVEYVLDMESKGISPEEKRIIDYFRNINDSIKPHIKGILKKIMEEFPNDVWSLSGEDGNQGNA